MTAKSRRTRKDAETTGRDAGNHPAMTDDTVDNAIANASTDDDAARRAPVPPDPDSTAYTPHPSPSGGPVPADEGSVVAGPEGSTAAMAQDRAAEEFQRLRDAEDGG